MNPLNVSAATLPSTILPLPGMGFANRVLGGGLPEGKLVGLVGPSGGGKTLLAMQIVHAALLQGKRVLYLGYEPNNAIGGRFLSLAMGGVEKLSPWLKSQCESEMNALSKRFYYVGPDRILGSVSNQINSFESPADLVVVDQLSMMLMHEKKETSWRSIQNTCRQLRREAERSGSTILLLHQKTAASLGDHAIKKPVVSDVTQSRSFVGKDVDVAIFIGTKSDEGLCWISCPQKGLHELVWLDGANARFRGVGQLGDCYEVDLDAGKFVLSAEAELAGLERPVDVVEYFQAGLNPGQKVPYVPNCFRSMDDVTGSAGEVV